MREISIQQNCVEALKGEATQQECNDYIIGRQKDMKQLHDLVAERCSIAEKI